MINISKVTLNAANERPPPPVVCGGPPAGPGGGGKMCSGAWKLGPERPVGVISLWPDDWKRALVTPIFKKGARSKPENYRPVSVMAICCKVAKHIIVSQTMRHLDHHNILVDCQHGFCRKRSCEMQLLITTHDLAAILNRHSQADVAVQADVAWLCGGLWQGAVPSSPQETQVLQPGQQRSGVGLIIPHRTDPESSGRWLHF